ncbi:hypothetical protein Tco_0559083 [Tanacetum coccineum]
MSSASSAVTYTSVYTDSEPRRVFWGADEEISDGGSPRVIIYRYDGLPIQLVAPPSPNCIPGPEEPQTPPIPQDKDEHEPMFIQPHDPDYVPEPIYPEYIPLEDEHEFSAEEQPLPPVVSPTLQASISLPPEVEVERLLAMPTPPPSPPISLSPPSAGERLARIASTQALVDAVTAALPSPLLPPLPPSLYIPPPVDHRDNITESERPPRKRSCLFALGSRYEWIRKVGYGIRDTWVDPAEAVPEIAHMTVREDSRTRISQRVTMDLQRIDLLMEDRIAHQETILIVEEDAYASREAWAHAIGLSQEAYYELQTHREQMQQAEMTELREIDRRHQAQIVETLCVMRDMRREHCDMQAELLALLGQRRRARQPRLDARAPDHQEASRDADSHI